MPLSLVEKSIMSALKTMVWNPSLAPKKGSDDVHTKNSTNWRQLPLNTHPQITASSTTSIKLYVTQSLKNRLRVPHREMTPEHSNSNEIGEVKQMEKSRVTAIARR